MGLSRAISYFDRKTILFPALNANVDGAILRISSRRLGKNYNGALPEGETVWWLVQPHFWQNTNIGQTDRRRDGLTETLHHRALSMLTHDENLANWCRPNAYDNDVLEAFHCHTSTAEWNYSRYSAKFLPILFNPVRPFSVRRTCKLRRSKGLHCLEVISPYRKRKSLSRDWGYS